jgi:hypothetical protein
MYIERMRIDGFKSLHGLVLDNLGPINILHGLNDVGKSNILEAIDLFLQLLPLALDIETDWEGVTDYDLRPYSSDAIFRFQSPKREIQWDATLRLSEDPYETIEALMVLRPVESPRKNSRALEEMRQPTTFDLTLKWPAGAPGEGTMQKLRADRAGFTLVSAQRRFQDEQLGEEQRQAERRTRRPEVSARNLKRTLFEAFASLDLEERARFKRLQELLDRHFQVGTLDVGLKRTSKGSEGSERQVVVRFLRPRLEAKGAITLENAGSGVSQVLLILGQILFNMTGVVGVEEPEMNLNPIWQKQLMAVFGDLALSESGGLDQIFITSHSPTFEFQESFYLVTYQNQATQIERAPLSRKARFFGPQQPLGERCGQRINSQHQITLYREVMEDLGLEYGDMIYFNKGKSGRWTLYAEDEALQELREAWNDETN